MKFTASFVKLFFLLLSVPSSLSFSVKESQKKRKEETEEIKEKEG